MGRQLVCLALLPAAVAILLSPTPAAPLVTAARPPRFEAAVQMRLPRRFRRRLQAQQGEMYHKKKSAPSLPPPAPPLAAEDVSPAPPAVEEPSVASAPMPPPSPPPAAEGIQSAINARLKAAMKERKKEELSAIRLMAAAMTTKQKEEGLDGLDDATAQSVLAKLAKMRQESIEMFEKGGKTEAAAKEKFELALIQEYLPRMADESTVRRWIDEAVKEACPEGPDKKLMGKVMGALMKAHKGEFDGKQANVWVKEALEA
ncbi:hypothetical protein AB1Y20_005472 [Prymnesium parvum]|uniref:GatB/YqeY domain-containing protein n=1 Tax=Prymnesium parvum TaxID=97485 RepID=A0AB34J4E0_PRYPA